MQLSKPISRKMLSHEFNTTLAGILNNTELLRHKHLSRKQARTCLNDIYSSGQRLSDFLNALLTVAKQMPGIDKEEVTTDSPKNESNSQKLQNNWLSILLVEDEPIIQRVHSAMLEELNCHVDIASDGYQALEMLKGKHNYEVVFMDIGLPQMDGIETVEKIRHQGINNTTIPIVGLTAYQLEDVIEECKTAGFNNLTAKPLSLQKMKSMLTEIAKQRINYQVI